MCRRKRSQLLVPQGYPAVKNAYQSSKLFLGIIWAFYHALKVEKMDIATFTAIAFIAHPLEEVQNEAGIFIDNTMVPFYKHFPSSNPFGDHMTLSEMGPYLFGKQFSYKDNSGQFIFEGQISIFSETGNLIEQYPEDFDESSRQLYLVGDKNKYGEYVSMAVITNLTTFFNQVGLFCFFCKKNFGGRSYRHLCKKRDSCQICHRPKEFPETYKKEQNNMYCPIQENPLTCERCQSIAKNSNCLEAHQKKVCQYGWFCAKCKKRFAFTGKYRTAAALEKNHICNKERCRFCGEQYTSSDFHLCSLQKRSNKPYITNMGFLSLTCITKSAMYCKECFEIRQKKGSHEVCLACSDKPMEDFPNMISLLIEEGQRGRFFSYSFTDVELETKEKNEILISYPLPYEKQKSLGPALTAFLKPKRTSKLFIKGKTPIATFLRFLLKNYPNTTILVSDEEFPAMQHILCCLCENNIAPNVVQNGSYIMLIEIKSTQVRFINMKNYFPGTLRAYSQRYNIELIYFPIRLNKRERYGYDGEVTFDDFFCIDDTLEDIRRKKIFFESLILPWDFNSSLQQYSYQQTLVLVHIFSHFLNETYKCEKSLIEYFDSKMEFIHPFTPPIFTIAAYAFDLLLKYTPNLNELKIVKPGINMRSSRGELEYVEYIRSKNTNTECYDSWSKLGQKHFKEAWPDIFFNNEAHFYHGCLVHGHPVQECLYKRKNTNHDSRNMFGTKLSDAYDQTSRKTELLKKNNSGISKVVEIWSCEWEKLKRENDGIRQFLANEFVDPPLCRLNPKLSCK